MTTELLPCPFCGGVALSMTELAEWGREFHVECDSCFCRTSFSNDEAATDKAWNTRTLPADMVTNIEAAIETVEFKKEMRVSQCDYEGAANANDNYHHSDLNYQRSPIGVRMSSKESLEIHKEENRVYFSNKIGFYVVEWLETGNNDIPQIIPIHNCAKTSLTG